MNGIRSLLASSVHLLISNAVSNGSWFVLNLLLARELTPSGYASFITYVSIATLFALAAHFGIPAALPALIAREANAEGRRRTANTSLTILLIAGAAAALLLVILAPLLCRWFPTPEPGAARHLSLFAAGVFALAVYKAYVGIFNGRLRTGYTLAVSLAQDPLRLAVPGLMAVAGYGMTGIVAGWNAAALAGLVLTALLYRRLGRKDNLSFSAGLQGARTLFTQSRPYLLPFAAPILIIPIVSLMVQKSSPPEELALFAATLPFGALFPFLFVPIQDALLPRMARIGTGREWIRTPGLAALIYGLALAVLTLLVFASAPLLGLAYGSRFPGAAALLPAILAYFCLDSLRIFPDSLLNGLGHAAEVNRSDLVKIAVILASALWLVPTRGAAGAAMSMAAGAFASSFFRVWRLHARTGINLFPLHGLFIGAAGALILLGFHAGYFR